MRSITILVATFVLALPLAAGAHHRPGHTGGNLTIAANPDTLSFGRTTTISGRLTGAGNGGVTIELQRRPHPFTAAFEGFATTTTTTTSSYSFRAVQPREHTRYRVVARTAEPQTSGEETVTVSIRVGFRVSDRTPRRGQRVNFSGFARPAHDGAIARIQRRTSTGSWRTVARARLVDAGEEISRYARRLRVYRDGVYRVFVPGDADHASGRSGPRRLDVR
ncbi:MAG TPA: hypothetical protein VNT32_12190 [Thermoleophilaceae bacterium]|nr:hypothetical protein [Thermoleophilaceae bacterium]